MIPVSAHVAVEVPGLGEPSIADLTLIRFLARVRTVVLREGGAVGETLATRVTLVRSVARVRAQVRRDGAALRETSLTDGTFERFFAAVRPEVGREVGGLGEGLLADGALIRFLAVVRAEMRLERRLPRVRLSADVARVGTGKGVPARGSYDGAAGNAERRRRRGVMEGTVRLGVSGGVAEGAG